MGMFVKQYAEISKDSRTHGVQHELVLCDGQRRLNTHRHLRALHRSATPDLHLWVKHTFSTWSPQLQRALHTTSRRKPALTWTVTEGTGMPFISAMTAHCENWIEKSSQHNHTLCAQQTGRKYVKFCEVADTVVSI